MYIHRFKQCICFAHLFVFDQIRTARILPRHAESKLTYFLHNPCVKFTLDMHILYLQVHLLDESPYMPIIYIYICILCIYIYKQKYVFIYCYLFMYIYLYLHIYMQIGTICLAKNFHNLHTQMIEYPYIYIYTHIFLSFFGQRISKNVQF